MKAKITKRLVDDTPAGTKPLIVFDTDLAGFVLKMLPTGKRIYQLRLPSGASARRTDHPGMAVVDVASLHRRFAGRASHRDV